MRALLRGWIEERWVPDPAVYGVTRLRFFLAQPFAERWRETVLRLEAVKGLVDLWCSTETVFGLICDSRSSTGWRATEETGTGQRLWTVDTSPDGPGMTAYFDLEGAWSAVAADGATLHYPRAFPKSLNGSPPSAADLVAIQDCLRRGAGQQSGSVGFSPFKSYTYSRRERRLRSDERISRRVFLNLQEIPRIHDWRAETYVFVTGEFREGTDGTRLFRDLADRCRVAPFVFVFDASRVLMVTLAPAPPGLSQRPESVRDTLTRHLVRIEVVRESIGNMLPLADHRFDRLSTAFQTSEAVRTSHALTHDDE